MKQNLNMPEFLSRDIPFTEREILNQPKLWIKIYNQVKSVSAEISDFLKDVLVNDNLQVIFTGAGSSAFIGETVRGAFQKESGLISNSIHTTDIITHPTLYIKENNPLLLVSFARSGNSPESSKVIELSERISRNVYHLVITCAAESPLLTSLDKSKHYKILLPPESNDQGLAMTGSFTGMLLAGLLLTRINNIDSLENHIQLLSEYGQLLLDEYKESLQGISEKNFTRAVFLGSGLLKGIAQESHLKLQELTDGRIICKYDSFLGFRHGPRAVIDGNTLIVYLFSSNSYANNYEKDLVRSATNGRKSLYSLGISEQKIPGINLDFEIVFSEIGKKLDEDLLTIPLVLPAQILGFYKSLNLGLNPDSPSNSGMITRVVEGVKLYKYEK